MFALLLFNTPQLRAQAADAPIFRDDFSRKALGSFWQTPTQWSIKKGAAHCFTDGTGASLRTAGAYSQSSFVIETAALGFTGSYMREFRITFGQGSLSDQKMYVVSYLPYNGGVFSLGRATTNVLYPRVLDEMVLYPNLDATAWYKFKIARYKSGLIQVYVDRGAGYGTKPLLEAIDTTYTSMGHVGWQVDTQTAPESFFVDWITAYKPAAEKPATREKPAEDKLITQVSAESGKAYTVGKLTTGVKAFTDRSYTITSVPPYLAGASFIQTANDDKKSTSPTFLTSFLKQAAVVYIGYDPRATTLPDWLKGWTKTGDRIGISDPGTSYLDVYSNVIEYGDLYPYPFILGGNMQLPASGAQLNYLVAAIPLPRIASFEAEAAALSGAVVAADHAGYSGTGFADYKNLADDYIEWTVNVQVPGTYVLSFTFANGGAADRNLQITSDGKTLGVYPFSSTSSWSSWATFSGVNVFLTRGHHQIRATATGASGPNMDYLSLSYHSSATLRAQTQQIVQQVGRAKPVQDFYANAYPNPFAGSLKIVYHIAQKANVQLSLLSVQGQQLRLLVNEIKEAGDYQQTLDGSGLAAGVYFYRLQVGNKMMIGKLIKQ